MNCTDVLVVADDNHFDHLSTEVKVVSKEEKEKEKNVDKLIRLV